MKIQKNVRHKIAAESAVVDCFCIRVCLFSPLNTEEVKCIFFCFLVVSTSVSRITKNIVSGFSCKFWQGKKPRI